MLVAKVRYFTRLETFEKITSPTSRHCFILKAHECTALEDGSSVSIFSDVHVHHESG